MPTQSVSSLLSTDSQPPPSSAHLFLRTAPPRGRFGSFFAAVAGRVAGSVAYGMAWSLCALFELGDPGAHALADLSPSQVPRTETPTWRVSTPRAVIAPNTLATHQVTPVVQQGAYRSF